MLPWKFLLLVLNKSAVKVIVHYVFNRMHCEGMTLSSTKTLCVEPGSDIAIRLAFRPALGFIHTGKMLSFVYDVADLYKTDLTIPIAFHMTAEHPVDLERMVRMECRKTFYEYKLMERILPDVAEVLDAGDDVGESPEEFEGRIVTLDVGTEDWSVPRESERTGSR